MLVLLASLAFAAPETVLLDGSEAFRLHSDSNPTTWEEVSGQFMLPMGTDVVRMQIAASEDVYNDRPGDVGPEFDGHYADDVVLSIGELSAPSANNAGK